MKISVSMWSVQKEFFLNKIDTIGFIKLVSKWGVDGVELLDFFFKNEAEIQDVTRLLDEMNLPVASFSIENDFAVEYAEELDAQIAYVKEAIDTAVQLKTSMLRVLSGYKKPNVSFDKGMEYVIKGLKSCTPYAAEKGITLVLENHGMFSGTSAKVRNIIDNVASPNLRANADTGNFYLELENPVDGVKNLKDLINFVHFKDLIQLSKPNGKEIITAADFTLYQGTRIGMGDVDLHQIVSILKQEGYKGYLSVEYEGVDNCITDTEESVAFLKSLLKNA